MNYSEVTPEATSEAIPNSSSASEGSSDRSSTIPSETSFESANDSAVSNPSSQSYTNPPKSIPNSQLPMRESITPSRGTIFITLGILVPIMLLFVALFSGTIQP